mgnify:CR=1 FL=1
MVDLIISVKQFVICYNQYGNNQKKKKKKKKVGNMCILETLIELIKMIY